MNRSGASFTKGKEDRRGGRDVFCEEPIKRVYRRWAWEREDEQWCDSFLQLEYSLEYHTTDGYWLVFETKNHVITVGADGVKLWDSLREAVPNQEELEDLSPTEEWEQVEHTLFVGEHICDVQKQEKCWDIRFDHFAMKLYTYDNTKQRGFNLGGCSHNGFAYRPMSAGNHMLTRRCSCGGEGELIIDHVDDFLARCRKCQKSTWAGMCLIDAIEDWNAGETPIELNTGEEAFVEQIAKEPVKYIDVSKDGFWLAKANLCDADHVMVVFSDCSYLISSTRITDDQYDFTVIKCSDYNKASYGMQITSWENKEIRCLGFESDEFSRYLRFEIDGSYLLLTPDDTGLMVGFTGYSPAGNAYEMKRRALFKGYEDA